MVSVVSTDIPDVKLITPVRHRDARGFFVETWNKATLLGHGLALDFVQDNMAHSKSRGTLRGLHFQRPPMAQGKLLGVLAGAVFDVALDLRQGSPTYGRHVTATLSAEEGSQLWIPEGFAHGYCTLEDDTTVFYKQTAFYAPELEAGILWDDPALAIPWPVTRADAILSDKDLHLPPLAEWEAEG